MKQKKEYNQNNREKVAEYQKKYREKNKEKISAELRQARYLQSSGGRQDYCKSCFKSYYQENKEQILKQQNERYEQKKEEIKKQKEYERNNKDKRAKYQREYRQRIRESKR